MSFADHIAESGTTLFWYVRISGLPHVWSNVPLPSSWFSSPGIVTIDGEEYAAHATLVPDQRWADTEERAQPWTGLAEASQLDFDFLLPGTPDFLWEAEDAWMQILAASSKRGASSVLVADLTPGGGAADTENPGAFINAGDAYIGLETVRHIGGLADLTRGCYGSWPLYHVGDLDQVHEAGHGGPRVADHPLALAGRVVTLWIGTAYDDHGTLHPFGAAPCSSEDRAIWAGLVRRGKPDKGQARVHLQCESLRSILANPVGERLPRATPAPLYDAIYLCDDCNTLGWAWIYGDAATDPNKNDVRYHRVRLQRDDGGGKNSEPVPDGWYSIQQLSQYISWTITQGMSNEGFQVIVPLAGGASEASATLAVWSESDGQRRWQLNVGTTDTTASNLGYSFHVLGATGSRSLWRALGWTGEPSGNAADLGAIVGWEVNADRRRPAFYLPAGTLGRQIPYRLSGSLDFTASPGWTDDDGDAIGAFCRVGEEVVSVSAVTTADIAGVAYGVPVLTISGRGELGSLAEEIYIESDVAGGLELPAIVQGLVFPDTTWGRAGAYLAAMMAGDGSNGPFDVGWRGGGAAIPEALLDLDSWLEVAGATNGRRTIAIFDTTPLDEVLGRNLVLSQAVLAAMHTDTGYVLRAIDMRPALEHEGIGATVLDTSNLITRREGIDWEAAEAGVVATVIGQNLAYDHGADDDGIEVVVKNGTAAGTWSDTRPLEVDLRDVGGGADAARDRLLDFAQIIWAAFGEPYLVLQLSIALPEVAWMLEIGSFVEITHPLILQRAAVARGVTGLVGRVFAVKRSYRGGGVAGRVVVLAQEGGTRFAGYAPSAYATAVSSATLTCLDHYDSYDGDELKDVEHFVVGGRVRVYQPGNEDTSVLRTVQSISVSGSADASQIVLTLAPGLAAPVIVEPADYDDFNTSDEHRRYAYLSDGDGVLHRPDGSTDTAYEYL